MVPITSLDDNKHRRSWSRVLFNILFAIFLSGGFYFGYIFYTTVHDFFAYAQFASLPNLDMTMSIHQAVNPPKAPQISEPQIYTDTTEVADAATDNPPAKRINILLLGIDQRVGEHGPWRTDTMMVVTIDPNTESVGLLSIPRDLWVIIPGYGESRINTAHFKGDQYSYPGGGPALAMKTIQHNFGIPLDYYVRVNFDGFMEIIDRVDGVTVEITQEIYDEHYPDPTEDDPGRFKTIHIPAGIQHMDSETALQYVRSRHGSDDFNRMERQQKLLLAVRDQVLSSNLLARIPEIPKLMETLDGSIRTDMPPDVAISLAFMGAKFDPSNIETRSFDRSMAKPVRTEQGWEVLQPQPEQIRQVVYELFGEPAVMQFMPAHNNSYSSTLTNDYIGDQ